MTCTEIQHVLYSTKADELQPFEQELLAKHLANCPACTAEFQKISEADHTLARLKHLTPRIRNEQALTESILASILGRTIAPAEIQSSSFLDRLMEVFSRKSVRFACVFIVLFSGMAYIGMEYNDAAALVNLEQRLGMNTDVQRAVMFQQEINVLHFLNELYQFSTGVNSSVELTNTLILMKKTDIQSLLKGYETLDENSQKRLSELWNTYSKKEPPVVSNQHNREEIITLRKEIERLKKELDHYTHRNKLP